MFLVVGNPTEHYWEISAERRRLATLHQRLGEQSFRTTATWDRRHQVGAATTWEEEIAALPYEHRVSIQTRKAVERLPAKQVCYLRFSVKHSS